MSRDDVELKRTDSDVALEDRVTHPLELDGDELLGLPTALVASVQASQRAQFASAGELPPLLHWTSSAVVNFVPCLMQ